MSLSNQYERHQGIFLALMKRHDQVSHFMPLVKYTSPNKHSGMQPQIGRQNQPLQDAEGMHIVLVL